MRELVHSPSDTQSPFLLDVSNLNPEEIFRAEPRKVPDVCVSMPEHMWRSEDDSRESVL